MPVKFNDTLDLKTVGGKSVVAAWGPLGDGEAVDEVCAWVFQDDAAGDAAATEMTTTLTAEEIAARFFGGPGEWKLELAQISNVALHAGDAFAVAVALVKKDGSQKVVWWGHPVSLIAVP